MKPAPEEDYNKKNTSEPKFATEHFIPTGLFTDDGQTATAHAMFGGIIKTAEKEKFCYRIWILLCFGKNAWAEKLMLLFLLI